jgi:hypothetical protein
VIRDGLLCIEWLEPPNTPDIVCDLLADAASMRAVSSPQGAPG